ncbi:MAG: TonB-dependent receptor [Chitinophagales bacterium]|nr:TonB-dependent receptor [Chitinophagales bacterium]
MRKLLLSILVVLMVFRAGAQCHLSFSGIVWDADTGQPLADALVRIPQLNLTKKTDSSGRFKILGICPGNYDVVISHVSCKPVQEHLHIEKDIEHNFKLDHAAAVLNDVTVTGYNTVAKKTSFSAEIKGKELDAVKGLSLGESLTRLTGVTTLQTGTNIYKPVIHGLHSNRVLILNNGIRQEGQQWGSEHAPEIDPYVANRLTVIKGASSLRYGADAIGGVVLVEPKLLPVISGTRGELNLAAFSNNRMGVLSGMLEGVNLHRKPFAWRVQGTLRRGGNAATPEYSLANSGLSEANMSATAGWKKETKGWEVFYSLFNTKLGIFSGAHIGNVTDLMNAIAQKEPPDYIRNVGFTYKIDRPYQEVMHHLLKWKSYWQTGETGRLNLIAAAQVNNRQEYDVKRFQSSSDAPGLDLTISTVSADLLWDHYQQKGFRGTIGINSAYQANRYSFRLFIPNYDALNLGAFIIEKIGTGKLQGEFGARYDHRSITNISSNTGRVYTNRTYSSFSGNAGLQYQLHQYVQLSLGIASAWRAPQVNELYSDGLHHGSARIEKGNDQLNPERANSVMAGLHLHLDKFNLELETYHKQIDGFIYLYPVFPPELTIRGAFPTFRYGQTNTRMQGVDVNASWKINAHIQWQVKGSVLRAWDKTNRDWMIMMPSDRYETSLEYRFSDAGKIREPYVKLHVQHVLHQSRFPGTGNIPVLKPDGSTVMESDYIAPPPAYTLAGAEAGLGLQRKQHTIQFILSATNMLNVAYREYLNTFRYFSDDMGRNISLRVRIPFNVKNTPS